MDTKKLDKWAELLLDTGKRNNLVHFKDTRASTAEVLFPSPEALFEKMDGSASFEVFDPKISDTDAPDEAQTSLPELAGSGNFIGKDAFFGIPGSSGKKAKSSCTEPTAHHWWP